MTPDEKKAISKHLKEALVNEHMWNSTAAQILNIRSEYLSMIMNPNLWNKAPQSAWDRLNEWHSSAGPISEFKIPEGKQIKEQHSIKKQYGKPKKEKKNAEAISEHSPENLDLVQRAAVHAESFSKPDTTYPFGVKPEKPTSDLQFTDTARLKVALDIEINLVVNGQKIQLR
jgi:hypothetical protein